MHRRNREGLSHTATAMKDHSWTAHLKGKRNVLKLDSFGKLIASLEGRHVVEDSASGKSLGIQGGWID